ncbi:hypothetical protein ACX80O_03425 [Arthrobacter sp. Hz1]
MTQRGITELFGKDVRIINEHIQNVITEARWISTQLSGNSG